MTKYRKLPVEVEAVQFTDENIDNGRLKRFFGIKFCSYFKKEYQTMEILTLEGTLKASKGDWMIKGIQGEIYPCKDEIFKQTYERIEDET